MTKEDKIAYSKLYHKFNARIERYGYRLFYRALRQQVKPYLEYLKQGGELIETSLESIISQDVIRIALTSFYASVSPRFLKFFDIPLKQKDIQPSQTINLAFRDQQKLNELGKLAESTEVGAKIKNITDTTRKLIKDTIAEGFRQNKPREQIIRDINTKTKGLITINRARLISRTETTYIANKAAEVNTMYSPFKMQKEWIPIVDFRTRDSHLKMMNKKPIPKEELFSVGGTKMKYPGDPAGGAAQTCNCRCIVHYSPIDESATEEQTPILQTIIGTVLIEELLADLLK